MGQYRTFADDYYTGRGLTYSYVQTAPARSSANSTLFGKGGHFSRTTSTLGYISVAVKIFGMGLGAQTGATTYANLDWVSAGVSRTTTSTGRTGSPRASTPATTRPVMASCGRARAVQPSRLRTAVIALALAAFAAGCASSQVSSPAPGDNAAPGAALEVCCEAGESAAYPPGTRVWVGTNSLTVAADSTVTLVGLQADGLPSSVVPELYALPTSGIADLGLHPDQWIPSE